MCKLGDKFQMLVLFSYHVGLGELTQLVRLGCRWLYPMSHLTNPVLALIDTLTLLFIPIPIDVAHKEKIMDIKRDIFSLKNLLSDSVYSLISQAIDFWIEC